MEPNSPSQPESIEDRREADYLRLRKASRRRQLVVALAVSVLASGWIAWRVGSHWIASGWLEANHYRVSWDLDRDRWTRGGATSVRYVERFDIFQSDRRNVDLRFLHWLHRVEELDLAQATGLRDEYLIGLDRLKDLRILNLDRSLGPTWLEDGKGRLTDAILDRVGQLSRLRDLNLSGHRITDAGLSKLTGLGELVSLDLSQTGITDAGLETLAKIPRLKILDLTGTRVTALGVRDFEAARPGVTVVTDPSLAATLSPRTPKP